MDFLVHSELKGMDGERNPGSTHTHNKRDLSYYSMVIMILLYEKN